MVTQDGEADAVKDQGPADYLTTFHLSRVIGTRITVNR
jgi:hypothetical protein